MHNSISYSFASISKIKKQEQKKNDFQIPKMANFQIDFGEKFIHKFFANDNWNEKKNKYLLKESERESTK